MIIKALNNVGKVIKGSKVLIMGLTYKENVPDTRETPVKEIIKELKEFGVDIYGYDPLLNNIESGFGIKPYGSPLPCHCEQSEATSKRRGSAVAISTNSINSTNQIDCVIVAVAHDAFQEVTLDKVKSMMNDMPILIDIKGLFSQQEATRRGFYYTSL